MNETQPPLPSGVAQLCFRYQSALDAGKRPRIEDLLRETPAEHRPAALRALLAVEWACRRQRRESFDEDEYCERFPSQASSIREWLNATDAPAGVKRGPAAAIVAPPGYEIIEELGRGGMGVVFKARDIHLKRLVAIKMILGADLAGRSELDRFQREAEVTARLAHEGIVQVYHVGTHQDRPYLVMELVAGGSLASKLRGQPVPARQVATIVSGLARAVEAAHEEDIIHRDLKPGNVLVGPNWQLKIGDFGLARRLDEQGQTRTGAVLGTPAYMAPEQAMGKKDVGPAADIYSLGAILYELLTGKPPFHGAMMDILQAVMHRDPVRPALLNPKVSPDLETICLKCLEKEPDRRYRSAGELAEDLERFLRHEPIRARPAGVVERLVKNIRRRPARAAVIGLTAVAVLCGSTGWYFASKARWWEDAADTAKQEKMYVEEERQRDDEKRNRANAELVRRRREQERLALYQRTLLRAEVLWPAAPVQARALLEDATLCPVDLREANHQRLSSLSTRSAGTIPIPAPEQESPLDASVGKAFAFSPDGKVMARTARMPAPPDGNPVVVRSDVLLELVDLDTGRVLHTLAKVPHPGTLEGKMTFSPDGRLLAVALDSRSSGIDTRGGVRLWNVGTGKPLTGIQSPPGNVSRILFHPDGRSVAVQTEEQGIAAFDRSDVGRMQVPLTQITLFDVRSGREVRTLCAERMHISAVNFSADGRRLLTAGQRADGEGNPGGWVALWDVAAGKKVFERHEEGHRLGILAAALSPDAKTLVWPAPQEGQGFGTPPRVHVWNVEKGKMQPTLAWDDELGPFAGGSLVQALARLEFDPTGKRLVLCDAGGRVKLLEVTSGKSVLSYSQGGPVTALTFARGGEELITGATRQLGHFGRSPPGGAVQRWLVRSGKAKNALNPPMQVRCVALSPDGKMMALGTEEWADGRVSGGIILSDLATGKNRASWPAHAGPVRSLAFSPDGQTLASGGMGKPIGAGLGGFPGHASGEVKLWPVSDAGSGDVLNLATVGVRQAMLADVTALQFEPGGKRLAIAMGAAVFLQELTAGTGIDPLSNSSRVLIEPPLGGALGTEQVIYSLAFSPDGRFVAAGGLRRDQSVRGGFQAQPVQGIIRIVDVREARELITYPGHSGAVHWLAFAADGQTLVSGSLPEKPGQQVEGREWDTGKVFDRVRRGNR